jgi:AraC family transcriptional regulator of arabinose operon
MPVSAEDLLNPAAELVVVGYYDQRPGYAVHRATGASSWLFAWTVAGAGQVHQGSVAATAVPGELIVLGPDVTHGYRIAEGAEHWAFWWAHCSARSAWYRWLRPYHLGDRVYRVGAAAEVADRIGEVFARLQADSRWSGHGRLPSPVGPPAAQPRTAVAGAPVARELARSGIEQVLLLAAGAQDGGGSGLDPRVRRVDALITADPAEPHTVASLAAAVSLSPSRLAHLFAEQTGRTPMQALRAARLAHAARLLELTDLPVDRVASACGFASAFHFSRLFRARFGVPPGAYRRPAG